MASNEGRACHAVVKLLERDLRSTYSNLTRPELDSSLPPVELTVTIAGMEYAFEHTRVEAFAGQIEAERIFAQLVAPIMDAFREPLAIKGPIRLYFPMDTRVGKAQLETVQREIITWVRDVAARFSRDVPGRSEPDNDPRAIVQNEERNFAGLKVLLRRQLHRNSTGTYDGHVLVARYTSGDVEAQRHELVGAALSRKLGKLQGWRQRGARTVLVLESNDIALSNEVVISEAVGKCLQDAKFSKAQPDALYLVDTCVDTWRIYTLKSATKEWLHERYDHDEAEFQWDELSDLTLP